MLRRSLVLSTDDSTPLQTRTLLNSFMFHLSDHTLNMLAQSGILTWLKTRSCWRMYRSLAVSLLPTNGILVIRNCWTCLSFLHLSSGTEALFMETSAKDGGNVQELFRTIGTSIKELLSIIIIIVMKVQAPFS